MEKPTMKTALLLAGLAAAPAAAVSRPSAALPPVPSSGAGVGVVMRAGPETLQGKIYDLTGTGAGGALPDGCRLVLAPGEYSIKPDRYTDGTCGNCDDPVTPVEATVGLRISGKGIVIEGVGTTPEEVVILTHSGYGILFEECVDCSLRNLTITGGVRDVDGRATDGAVVVKHGSVTIENCRIEGNIGDSAVIASTVVGIAGIVGREGATIAARGNRIMRNSWDGIVLYRGASGILEENVIDGVDWAKGRSTGGGRGVGIGVTWDGEATIRRNLVRRYWKGIGVFVDAKCDVRENVVEEMLAWGISLWDAGKGAPSARIERNIVFDTGACGISITREREDGPPPGSCRGNLVIRSGQNPEYDSAKTYCRQTPVAVAARPESFDLGGNLFSANRRSAFALLDDDLPRELLRERSEGLVADLSAVPSLRGAEVFEWLR